MEFTFFIEFFFLPPLNIQHQCQIILIKIAGALAHPQHVLPPLSQLTAVKFDDLQRMFDVIC